MAPVVAPGVGVTGGGVTGGVELPQAPVEVHGFPLPLPPLSVDGLFPWVHQFAV